MEETAPAQIGRYRIESVLGRGAMGVVYRAHDPEIDRTVAIKLIAADLLRGEAGREFVERFRREARAAGRCTHPNIVTVYDFALHDGVPFITMEFVEGESLAQRLTRAPQALRGEAAGIVLQALEALGAAHALGIVHRDIKPANILMARDGRVKVADFGVARLPRAEMTGTGVVIGSLAYMSPEQCRGEAVDARSDLFSLGAVFYQLLTGERPFVGANDASVMQKLLFETPPALAAQAGLPYASVLARAMSKPPAERFATAAEMRDAIRAWQEDPDAAGTVIMPPPVAAEPSNAATLSMIERKLAERIGPIAAHLVHQEVQRGADLTSLRRSLSARISDTAERERFLSETGCTPAPSSAAATSPASVTSPNLLAAAERALAAYLGPIAAVLVRKEAARSASADAFWTALAERIDDPKARQRFLAQRP